MYKKTIVYVSSSIVEICLTCLDNNAWTNCSGDRLEGISKIWKKLCTDGGGDSGNVPRGGRTFEIENLDTRCFTLTFTVNAMITRLSGVIELPTEKNPDWADLYVVHCPTWPVTALSILSSVGGMLAFQPLLREGLTKLYVQSTKVFCRSMTYWFSAWFDEC